MWCSFKKSLNCLWIGNNFELKTNASETYFTNLLYNVLNTVKGGHMLKFYSVSYVPLNSSSSQMEQSMCLCALVYEDNTR